MKEFKYVVKEWNKVLKRYQEVTHSVKADSLEEAIERFYVNAKNFGYTKTQIKEAINA